MQDDIQADELLKEILKKNNIDWRPASGETKEGIDDSSPDQRQDD